MSGEALEERGKRRADGYHGPEIADHGRAQSARLVEGGLRELGLKREELALLPKSDWRKALIAEAVQSTTTAKLDWISAELHMGARAGVCRAIRGMKERLGREPELAEKRKGILGNINI